jgi:hypothetical protein
MRKTFISGLQDDHTREGVGAFAGPAAKIGRRFKISAAILILAENANEKQKEEKKA